MLDHTIVEVTSLGLEVRWSEGGWVVGKAPEIAVDVLGPVTLVRRECVERLVDWNLLVVRA